MCLKVSRLLGKTEEKNRVDNQVFTFLEYHIIYNNLQLLIMKQIKGGFPGWNVPVQKTWDHYGPLLEDTSETTFLEALGG